MCFATVALRAFEIVDGEPPTSFGERWFCATCGTQIAMRVDHEPETIDVSVASFDRPETVPPHFHIWVSSRIRWHQISDELPRHERDRAGSS